MRTSKYDSTSMFMILIFLHITVLKYSSKIKTDYPASSNLYTLTYYKSGNRSSLYTSVFSISSKLSFTVTTSSLYVIPYQVSLLRNTLTDILFSANNSPINKSWNQIFRFHWISRDFILKEISKSCF